MPMFEGDVLRQTIAVASKYKIEPAALLAIIEVESAGRSRECDNTTPRLLFERHVFYRELKKAGVTQSLSKAVAAGLAHDGWRPGSQYKDQSTSAKRLALLIRVRAINEECANRSCSWGVGQTMGFLAQELKFTNANHMLQYLVQGGVPAQIDCMVREIVRKKIVGDLNAHNWARFSRVYNGPGYKMNAYDTKMAAAYAKWILVKLPAVDEPTPVIVPMEVTPDPFAKEVSGETKKIVAATAAGAASTAAGLWGFVGSMGLEMILFIVGILVLTVATVAIVARRRTKVTIQTGNLLAIDLEDATVVIASTDTLVSEIDSGSKGESEHAAH